MRYALLSLWMIGFCSLVLGLSQPRATAQVAASNSVTVTTNQSGMHFTVTGPYQVSREEARQAALKLAHEEVIDVLRSEGIQSWQPTLAFIRDRLVRSTKEEIKDLAEPVGTVRRMVLEISISPQVRSEITRQDQEIEHQARVKERMTSAGIILAGLVLVLGAIAGYLRLEELTKGYYTGWLLAGAGLAGAVAVGVVYLYFLA